MKRFISGVLLFCIIITSSGFMTACSAKENSELTMGEWLKMVNSMFGMQTYISEIPYFENISKDSPYFETVQIAVEWDVIDENEVFDINKEVTWKKALITLVNVGNFMDLEANEDDKIAFGIDNFDKSIRSYWMKRSIDLSSAVSLLSKAHELWVDRKYDVPVEKLALADGVINLTEGENLLENYKIDEWGNIIIPLSENVSIKEGDIFILPDNESAFEISTYKDTHIDSCLEIDVYLIIRLEIESSYLKDLLDIAQFKINLQVNESDYIQVVELPTGYNQDDIVYESSNSAVVEVEQDGKVIGKSIGDVIITIYTKDGKYKACCAISVRSNDLESI